MPDVALAGDLGANSLPTYGNIGKANSSVCPVQFSHHENGKRVPSMKPVAAGAAAEGGNVTNIVEGALEIDFIVPIYSGLIGLLMPEKKLIPLNLLPLDIEIVFNPHALYTTAELATREYSITKFNMYAHMLFFEQEIHRTLEASVADHGLFIYCNSFHSAPM